VETEAVHTLQHFLWSGSGQKEVRELVFIPHLVQVPIGSKSGKSTRVLLTEYRIRWRVSCQTTKLKLLLIDSSSIRDHPLRLCWELTMRQFSVPELLDRFEIAHTIDIALNCRPGMPLQNEVDGVGIHRTVDSENLRST
jgi:hypothetical protein